MNNPVEQFILITGNPVDGFLYIGTFKNGSYALEYAELHLKDAEYWINLLDAPMEDEE